MLGLAPGPSGISPGELRAGLADALADFHHCSRLADPTAPADLRWPSAPADDDTAQTSALLAATYTLATRMLIKPDDQQLGWMAADRAQVIATGSRDPLISAEAARNPGTPRPPPSRLPPRLAPGCVAPIPGWRPNAACSSSPPPTPPPAQPTATACAS